MSAPTQDEKVCVESLVGQVADEFTERLNRGEQPDIEEYARRYPEIAHILRQALPALQAVGALVPGSIPSGEPGLEQWPPSGILGDFRILREIGRGGMGVVYEAEQISLGRRVALKVLPFAATLDPKQLQRFKNEAQAAAQLHHTNIVPVFGVGVERGVHYYAMQYIQGQTLAAMIRELRQLTGLETVERTDAAGVVAKLASELVSGRCAPAQRGTTGEQPTGPYAPPTADHSALSTQHPALAATPQPPAPSSERSTKSRAFFRTVANLGVQAAEALEHAHQLGVVHRDIKPANLLVDVRGNLWITDFGLAHCQSQVGLTMTGDLVGTLRYMSPEQAMAKRGAIDHHTDVYSLGAALYELMTLEPAFSGSDRQELLRQLAFEEPRPPRRLSKVVPSELETIILKAMEKDPAERYATAQEMADDLRRFLLDRPIQARRAGRMERTWRWCRRNRAVASLLAAAVVLSTGLAVLALLLWDRQRQTEAALKQAEDQRQVAETRRLVAEANFQQVCVLLSHAPRTSRLLPQSAREKTLSLYERFIKEPGPDPAERLLMAQMYSKLAEVQHVAGKHAKAVQSYRKAINLLQQLRAQFPRESGFGDLLAWCYDQLGWLLPKCSGDLDEAEKAFEQAIALYEALRNEFPDIPYYTRDIGWSWSNLAGVQRSRGRFQQSEESNRRALALFQQLFDQRPTDVEQVHDLALSHNELAWVLAIRPDREQRHATEAVTHARKAVELEPGSGDRWHTLGVALCRTGNWKEALECIEKSRQLEYKPRGPGSFDLFFRSMAYTGLGDREQARRCYDQGVQWMEKHDPKHADLRRFRAEAAEMLKIRDKKNHHQDPKGTKNKP